MKPIRLGILGSTNGSNLFPMMATLSQKQVPYGIAMVMSNRANAGIIDKAKAHDLPWHICLPGKQTREDFDRDVSAILEAAAVDLIVLIGYMRILSPAFVATWRHRVINVHPSLLPAYGGLMDLAVHQAVLEDECQFTGCTVHEVSEQVDEGPILVQKQCAVLPEDTVNSLKAKVQSLEVEALACAIEQYYQENFS